jgi:hypothetical protein
MLVPGADLEDMTRHGEGARAFGVNSSTLQVARRVATMTTTSSLRPKITPRSFQRRRAEAKTRSAAVY